MKRSQFFKTLFGSALGVAAAGKVGAEVVGSRDLASNADTLVRFPGTYSRNRVPLKGTVNIQTRKGSVTGLQIPPDGKLTISLGEDGGLRIEKGGLDAELKRIQEKTSSLPKLSSEEEIPINPEPGSAYIVDQKLVVYTGRNEQGKLNRYVVNRQTEV